MKTSKYYLLDVFANEKYQGNPLAVFTNAHEISSGEMQSIAKEIHFSETTFITRQCGKNEFEIRIFTPSAEIPFAGHPAIGTAFIIREKLLDQKLDKIILDLPVGEITVSFEADDTIWMRQKEPSFGECFSVQKLAPVLSLNFQDIDDNYPIEIVSTGLPFIVVPLKKLTSLQKIKINPETYWPLIKNLEAKAILVFCPETRYPENQLSVRVFPLFYDVPEDPATGSGNGCLCGYLLKNNYFGNANISIQVEQGFDMGRPSSLSLKGKFENSRYEINVGGKAILLASGEWEI